MNVWHLTERETNQLREELNAYHENREYVNARVSIDFDGFKYSICRGIWSPPMGAPANPRTGEPPNVNPHEPRLLWPAPEDDLPRT